MQPPHLADLRRELAVSARERLRATGANGPGPPCPVHKSVHKPGY